MHSFIHIGFCDGPLGLAGMVSDPAHRYLWLPSGSHTGAAGEHEPPLTLRVTQ